jgi:hypothetical protein
MVPSRCYAGHDLTDGFCSGQRARALVRPLLSPRWTSHYGGGVTNHGRRRGPGAAARGIGKKKSVLKTVLGCTILAAMSWLTECWVLREASVQHHSSGRVHQRRPLRQSPLRCFYRVSIFHQPRSSTIVRRHSQNARSCLRPGYQIQFASPARSCCRRALLPPLRYVSYYLNL